MKLTQARLDHIIGQSCSSGSLHGCAFEVGLLKEDYQIQSAAGNLHTASVFYLASINKIFLSALALRLREEGSLKLEERILSYLPEEYTRQLLVYKGTDYSGDITLGHLISHTSGLPCYLIDKRPDGRKNMDLILAGEDQAWPLDKVVENVRGMKAKFPPGTKGKAAYSETNFRLLGLTLQRITGKRVNELLQNMFTELGMNNSFVLSSENACQCKPVFHKKRELKLTAYWDSSHHDVASSTGDLMIFLKAFFGGHFFPKSQLKDLKKWNNIFFPLKYGIGFQKFYMPRLLSPFKAVPEIIGHCGSVGSVAFYVPEKELLITGTINQAGKPQKAFQLMMRIINEV